MSEERDWDWETIEARAKAAILPDEEPAMADMNEEILALCVERRRLLAELEFYKPYAPKWVVRLRSLKPGEKP